LDPTPLSRALEVAPERAVAEKATPEQEFFCFRTGELQLGVPSENVREVVRAGPLTPLPRVPPFILGVAGHRGEVLPVLDLLRFLGKGEARVTSKTRLFIGTSGGYVTAVIADQILGLLRIPVSEIVPPPMGGDAASEHLLGVFRPGQKEAALSLVNFSKLLHAARQRAVSR
jgi:purine-binding chemotaxis protein CheW